MDEGSNDVDFFDLCEKYLGLAEARKAALAQYEASEGTQSNELLSDRIDDLDAQQRILMWRILCSGEGEPEKVAADTEASKTAAVAATERETGGTGRGRFDLRGFAGRLTGSIGKFSSRYG